MRQKEDGRWKKILPVRQTQRSPSLLWAAPGAGPGARAVVSQANSKPGGSGPQFPGSVVAHFPMLSRHLENWEISWENRPCSSSCSSSSLLTTQEQQGPPQSQMWGALTHKDQLGRGPRCRPPFPAAWSIIYLLLSPQFTRLRGSEDARTQGKSQRRNTAGSSG